MNEDAELALDTSLAQRGDRHALERVIVAIKDDLYRLALRMLGTPADAEDATQEALVRVITGLSNYRGESTVRTWAYRVTINQVLTHRRRNAAFPMASLEEFGVVIDRGVAAWTPGARAVDRALVSEARLVCTQAMLLCLDYEHRAAYVLGEVLDFSGDEAAAILEVSPSAYRKRLERARSKIDEFVVGRCGLINPNAACRCEKQIEPAIANGLVDPARLALGQHPARDALSKIERFESAATLMRSHPNYRAPGSLVDGLRLLLANVDGASS